jgi:hypothetical protein
LNNQAATYMPRFYQGDMVAAVWDWAGQFATFSRIKRRDTQETPGLVIGPRLLCWHSGCDAKH